MVLRRRWLAALILTLTALLGAATPGAAHPVPREAHDRALTVHLEARRVVVKYHLEVDEWTLVFVDVPAVTDKGDLPRLKQPHHFYERFAQEYGPVLAGNLVAQHRGQPLTFRCTKVEHKKVDSVWFDFVFEAPWEPGTGEEQTLKFREGNYLLQTGLVTVTLTADPGFVWKEKAEADEELKKKKYTDWQPGDEEKLRTVQATFTLAAADPAPAPEATEVKQPETPIPERGSSLLALLEKPYGLAGLLLLAGVFGAAHALTPGHGKTLVAAYLVGERGTALHAVALGLVTTITHTGSVILLAVGLRWFFPEAAPRDVQFLLGLVGGGLIAFLGFWLLMRRLTGGADHIHLGGGGHHHHGDSHGHHHHHHHHHEHEHHHDHEHEKASVGWWGLIVLGVSGGIVPCWDAIALFLFALVTQQVWLALPLLLAFSAGLAGVLVLIGLAVVYVKGFAGNKAGDSRLFKALPLVSAALVMFLGLWMCYDTVHAVR